MKKKLQIGLVFSLFFIQVTSGLFSEDLPVAINFGKSALYGRFITASELSIWGSGRNLKVNYDCPVKELQDYEAEIIPVHGMNFVMSAPGEGRVYLYLDLVTFLPAEKYDLSGETDYCSQKEERSSFPDKASLLPGIRWLEILVNGKSLKTIYEGSGTFIHSPVIITIDRENAMRRRLEISLRPSPGEAFFGIWDAFVVKSKYSDD